MPLIESNMLPQSFIDLLNVSTQVDIAVAWAGPSLTVETLLEQAEDKRIRIVVGLSGNNTEPVTLRRLLEATELRVARAPPGGIFHPKFYRFHGLEGTVCWVGSPNFTRGGFGGNTELVKEFADTNDERRAWFEALWQGLEEDPRPAIAQYEGHYRPPRPLAYRGAAMEWQGEFRNLQDLVTWEDFVAALHVLDDYCHQNQFDWDVLGETYSYLHTISVGRDVARRGNWGNFNRRDRDILCGLEHLDDTGAWGFLGNLRAAGGVIGAFSPPVVNQAALDHVLGQIGHVLEVGDGDIAQAAQEAVAGIRELHGFGPATATRFLALARPDRLVSMAGPAAAALGVFAEMPQDPDYLAENYAAFLQALYARPWFNAQEPADPLEREIWHCRAALVDAIVYIPVHE